MDLDVITPKIETEDLLVSIGKNCETPKKQTYRKAEKTLTFKLIKPKKLFHLNHLLILVLVSV